MISIWFFFSLVCTWHFTMRFSLLLFVRFSFVGCLNTITKKKLNAPFFSKRRVSLRVFQFNNSFIIVVINFLKKQISNWIGKFFFKKKKHTHRCETAITCQSFAFVFNLHCWGGFAFSLSTRCYRNRFCFPNSNTRLVACLLDPIGNTVCLVHPKQRFPARWCAMRWKHRPRICNSFKYSLRYCL